MYIKNSKTTLFAKCNKSISDNPLLFIHGFTTDNSAWNRVTPFIERNCIAVDIPGHGKSTFNEGLSGYNYKDWSIDLFLLLNQLGVKKIDICGYSMGGRLAVAFAAEYPNMVKSLILESTRLGIENKSKKRNRIKSDNKIASEILDDYISFIDIWQGKELFKNQKSRNLEGWGEQREARLSQNPEQLALSIKCLGLGKMPTFIDEFIQFDFPIYLINGQEDQQYLKIGKKIRYMNRNVFEYIIDNAGHNTHIDNPQMFVDTINNIPV